MARRACGVGERSLPRRSPPPSICSEALDVLAAPINGPTVRDGRVGIPGAGSPRAVRNRHEVIDVAARCAGVRVHRPRKLAVLRHTLGKDGEPRPVRIGVDDGVAARRRVRRWRRRGRSWGRRWRRQRGRSWGRRWRRRCGGGRSPGVPVGDALTLARRMKASGPAELAPRSPMAIACDWRVSSVHSVLRSAVVDPHYQARGAEGAREG